MVWPTLGSRTAKEQERYPGIRELMTYVPSVGLRKEEVHCVIPIVGVTIGIWTDKLWVDFKVKFGNMYITCPRKVD